MNQDKYFEKFASGNRKVLKREQLSRKHVSRDKKYNYKK